MLADVRSRALAFQKEAHAILALHEGSKSRVVILDTTYAELTGLSIRQDELIRQALRCTEVSLFRAAHVMAWAGFMDFLEEKMAADGLAKLAGIRPKWPTDSLEELRENVSEYQLIEAARDLKLASKNETKALHGMLNKRNECAHPSDFFPGLNETLGFISELLSRIRTIQPKSV